MPSEQPVSFESFMRRALYDPTRGYYSRRITGVGTSGDFTTVPMRWQALGKAISIWALRALKETRCSDLIELGPGQGVLAKQVLANLPLLSRLRIRLHLVETSAPLTAIQRATLGSSATWHETPTAALAACDGRAIIYSNELVDAFPVRRFQKTSEAWREIGVQFDDADRPSECLLPPSPLPISSIFSQSFPEGQIVEVHESYHHWLDSWLPQWKQGRMLTIDYGSTADRLYHRRPRGTIRAYLLQQRIEGPEIYQNIGRQDLTADVNFTDLAQWHADRLTNLNLMPLHQFIGPAAPPELSDPEGPGAAFQVLEQAPLT